MTQVIYGETNQPLPITGNPSRIFKLVEDTVDDVKGDTTQWCRKQQKYHRLRMGIKKTKTFPFPNSSNLRMPTAETSIRKVKAGIMGQVFGIRPIVQALPSPTGSLETADKIEKLIDHLVMDVMKIEMKSEVGVDQSLEKGFHLAKPYWRRDIINREENIDVSGMPLSEIMAIVQSPRQMIIAEIIKRFDIDMHDAVAEYNLKSIDSGIEKILKGKEKVSLRLKDIIYDYPDVDFISAERCYVPPDSGFDPQTARALTVETFKPLTQVKACAENKGWDMSAVNSLVSFKSLDEKNLTDNEKDMREGVSRLNNPSELVRVWETVGWFDLDGTGKQEKCMITTFPDFKQVARKVLLETLSGKYHIVKLFYELTDDRWFSHRGIPELLEDLIKEIDVQHNMKIDSQTMRNAPMIVYRAGMVNPNLARVNPAQGIPVNGMHPLDDTVKAINLHNPNTEYSYEREEMLLSTKIQEVIGQVDFSLQSMINRRQPRTLGEVEQQVQNAGQSASLDVKHYVDSFSQIFEMVFELWCQYGSDEYEFRYFGGSEKGESIRLTKEEVQGKYRITVRGNDQNTNPNIKIQKAQQILAAVTDPTLIGANVVTPQHMANGIKRFFQAMDINEWEELINTQPQPPQPPDPKTEIEPKYDELTDSEKAQILQSFGIVPDHQGRLRDAKVQGAKDAAEISEKLA